MKCIIAGGGTGGHLFPGIAIAEAFVEMEKGNEVLFVGTEKGIEIRILGEKGFRLKTIKARPIKGRSIIEKVKTIWTLPLAISEAVSILRDYRPEIVLGVGGYASGPVILAALILGLKRAIHEQNVIPGMTNRLLKYFVQKVFISFEETKRYFPKRKTIFTGMPVRREIVYSLIGGSFNETMEDKKDRFNIFIFGGSAGAHRINEKVIESLTYLENIRSSIRFIHQTGINDYNWVSEVYTEKGFDAIVKPFFNDMASYYRISDLIICRSGASSLAELAICGKAAILIPYPYAANQHQLINARQVVEMGAAMMIEDKKLNGEILAKKIVYLFNHPEERERMGKAFRRMAKPHAAQEIIRHCYKMVGR